MFTFYTFCVWYYSSFNNFFPFFRCHMKFKFILIQLPAFISYFCFVTNQKRSKCREPWSPSRTGLDLSVNAHRCRTPIRCIEIQLFSTRVLALPSWVTKVSPGWSFQTLIRTDVRFCSTSITLAVYCWGMHTYLSRSLLPIFFEICNLSSCVYPSFIRGEK